MTARTIEKLSAFHIMTTVPLSYALAHLIPPGRSAPGLSPEASMGRNPAIVEVRLGRARSSPRARPFLDRGKYAPGGKQGSGAGRAASRRGAGASSCLETQKQISGWASHLGAIAASSIADCRQGVLFYDQVQAESGGIGWPRTVIPILLGSLSSNGHAGPAPRHLHAGRLLPSRLNRSNMPTALGSY